MKRTPHTVSVTWALFVLDSSPGGEVHSKEISAPTKGACTASALPCWLLLQGVRIRVLAALTNEAG
ncbi:hypothetical protein MYX84_11680, partial [Acidobacteria bacterium AH-259-O06]|nr:hypothetical protein [Acidobacteria bacterium AH-259-O06]